MEGPSPEVLGAAVTSSGSHGRVQAREVQDFPLVKRNQQSGYLQCFWLSIIMMQVRQVTFAVEHSVGAAVAPCSLHTVILSPCYQWLGCASPLPPTTSPWLLLRARLLPLMPGLGPAPTLSARGLSHSHAHPLKNGCPTTLSAFSSSLKMSSIPTKWKGSVAIS